MYLFKIIRLCYFFIVVSVLFWNCGKIETKPFLSVLFLFICLLRLQNPLSRTYQTLYRSTINILTMLSPQVNQCGGDEVPTSRKCRDWGQLSHNFVMSDVT